MNTLKERASRIFELDAAKSLGTDAETLSWNRIRFNDAAPEMVSLIRDLTAENERLQFLLNEYRMAITESINVTREK